MRITREQLKNIVREVMTEESEYQTFFKKALEKTGKSIPQMSDEEKKAFFNKIDAAWDGKGEKNERFGRGHEGPTFGSADEQVSELTAAQEKLPPALKKAIEKKEKNESVNEDYKGPAILKLGDKNLLKVGEKITINTNGKKKEYKVVKSMGNGDFVLNVVESVNEASIDIKVGDMVKVDNPHWEGALGKKGPFRRKVKAIYDDNVFFTDGSNSSMKYIKK